MRITFGMIVFNSDFVLRQVLESIYPYANAICIAEGPVAWWQSQGFTHSTDDTIKIIQEFPDPEKKIHFVAGLYSEKTEQCRDWFKLVPEDTDYVWCIDADEVFKPAHIEKVIQVLKDRKPGSVGFQSNTFFGGFDYILGHFEREHNFKRILKYEKGCTYVDHRPPTTSCERGPKIDGKEMFSQYGVEMYHYSYVFPRQVYEKVKYYKAAVSKDKCIDNYFYAVWLEWVNDPTGRKVLEDRYNGVHEFIPSYRGECRTMMFQGTHPEVINVPELNKRFVEELSGFELEAYFNNKEEQDFLFSLLKPDMHVLEYGSGKSTVAIAKRVKSLVSVEHDERYYESTLTLIDEANVENVSLHHWAASKAFTDDGSINEFFDYITFVLALGPFDLVFIDGRARVDCAKAAVSHVNGPILIHDYGHPQEKYRRKEYEVVEEFLTKTDQVYALAKFEKK